MNLNFLYQVAAAILSILCPQLNLLNTTPK